MALPDHEAGDPGTPGQGGEHKEHHRSARRCRSPAVLEDQDPGEVYARQATADQPALVGLQAPDPVDDEPLYRILPRRFVRDETDDLITFGLHQNGDLPDLFKNEDEL